MSFVIEKGVPIPVGFTAGITGILRSMEVGDSFVIASHHRGRLHADAGRLGIKLTTRKEKEGFVRVWRTS